MIEPDAATPSGESYSPQLRTALVLTGTGTAGAYHAGVLRALQEAGVKIDIVAGRGVGVVGALFAAIDGGPRLWDDKGFWRRPSVAHLYPWRPVLRLVVWAVGVAVTVVAVPLLALALGLIVYPVDFVAKMLGLTGAGGLVGAYLRAAEAAFAPAALPTWLPRVVVLVLGAAGLVGVVGAWLDAPARRERGGFWWRLVRAPLSSAEAAAQCWQVMWDLVRGAAQLKQPSPAELGRRYTELLAENLGQPGFRELLFTVHDLDAHRDLVFALVAEGRRRDLIGRPTTAAAEERRAEVFDLHGVARDHLADAVAAALAIPVGADVHGLTFAPEEYWRGETHRVCDRPGAITRLLDELAALGVQQAIVVSAAAEAGGPHALTSPRLDGRGRIGDYLQSSEASAVRDALRAARLPRIFAVHPAHNPIGPFDFHGGYDERSDRRQPLVELMSRGYEDAYHQFIEPVVGASGDRVGQGVS